MKWTDIVRLRFSIDLVDGTRIGGSGGGLEIGGNVDANLAVLRNPVNDEPYIPGSSLKGKLRSSLEKEAGKGQAGKPCGCGLPDCLVCVIFGAHMKPGAASAPTRIVVRDAAFNASSERDWKQRIQEGKPVMEEKTENIINRKSGTAEHPRTGERVLPGTKFDAEVILHIYEGDDAKKMVGFVRHGLAVIQEASSLGAGGSRGSGRVRFTNLQEETIALQSMSL